MSDMLKVIEPKSDQLNGDDLIAGPRTITITGAKVTPGAEQPVALRYEGDQGKPWKPCKTMSKLLSFAWGPSSQEFVGKSLTLYRDPKVKWGGLEVGGIRVSHMSHIEKDFMIALTETRGVKKPISVKVLKGAPPASPTASRDFLAEINACPDRQILRAWWSANNEAIPEGDYESVLGAFNARLNAVPKTAPAATAPQEDEGAAALASQPVQEGRDDADMGEKPTLADAKGEVDDCETVNGVNSATAALLPLLGEEDADALRNYAMDRIAALS